MHPVLLRTNIKLPTMTSSLKVRQTVARHACNYNCSFKMIFHTNYSYSKAHDLYMVNKWHLCIGVKKSHTRQVYGICNKLIYYFKIFYSNYNR